MKIAVIGSGAIGSLVAGYLKFRDQDVFLAGPAYAVEAIKKHGLTIVGTRGSIEVTLDDIGERLCSVPDLTVLAVKTQDCEKAVKDNLPFLKSQPIITVQNGVEADTIVAKYLPKESIISSIVMFGATYLDTARIVHNFEGPWIMGNFFGRNNPLLLQQVNMALKKIFPVVVSDDIKGMKYLKIFLNANNCIPGILGVSMQEAFSDLEISRIGIRIWKEGLDAVTAAGIKIVSLPDFPLERISGLVSMPQDEGARVLSQIMTSLSAEPLYGSILQSIKRNRASEIDYINGEFVRLGKMHHCDVRINERLVEMVHSVEHAKKFFNKHVLFAEFRKILNENQGA